MVAGKDKGPPLKINLELTSEELEKKLRECLASRGRKATDPKVRPLESFGLQKYENSSIRVFLRVSRGVLILTFHLLSSQTLFFFCLQLIRDTLHPRALLQVFRWCAIEGNASKNPQP